MKTLRQFCIDLLKSYFNLVPVPPSFTQLTLDRGQSIVVTRSNAIVLEGLLGSLAQRAGFERIHHCSTSDFEPVSIPQSETTQAPSKILHWLALDEQEVLDSLAQSSLQVTLFTFNTFAIRGPIEGLPRYRMSWLDQIQMITRRRQLPIVFSQLPDFRLVIKPKALGAGRRLQRLLRLDFFRTLKLVRGTPFQSIDVQSKIILSNPDFNKDLQSLADHGGLHLKQLQRQARRAFFEIAAHPRRPMYSILGFIARFITNRLFSAVHTDGLDQLIPALRDNAVVLVPMHRSHLDYILIGSELYHAYLNPPLVAAGLNLSFFPAGFLIRSVGGYFVKRDARSDRVHALVLKRYVTYLLKRGHLQEFFIEGGRSRSGKMLAPKLGLLSVMVDVYRKGMRRDILFVPVSISYEQVIEAHTYGQENTGQLKQKESFWSLLKARAAFSKKYGEVLISFGQPISLAQYARAQTVQIPNLEPSGSGAANISVPEFGVEIVRRIRNQVNPSLCSLACTALMMSPGYALSRQELTTAIVRLHEVVDIQRQLFPNLGHSTPALLSFCQGKYELLDEILAVKIILRTECLGSDIFYIPGKRRFSADFYKNASIHLFFHVGLLSLLEVLSLPISAAQALRFKAWFVDDFLLPDDQTFQSDCQKIIDELLRLDFLSVTADGPRFASKHVCCFMPGLLFGWLQSLLWVLENLQASGSIESGSQMNIQFEPFMLRLQSAYRAGMYWQRTERTEGASRSSIRSALDTLAQMGIIRLDISSKKESRIKILRSFSDELSEMRLANQKISEYLRNNLRNDFRNDFRNSSLAAASLEAGNTDPFNRA